MAIFNKDLALSEYAMLIARSNSELNLNLTSDQFLDIKSPDIRPSLGLYSM